MKKENPVLIFRTDASPDVGTGHIMRCLALAQAWQDSGGDCVFLIAMDAGALFDRLIGENIEIKRIKTEAGSVDDALMTLEILQSLDAWFLVIDGYHFSSDYQKIIKEGSDAETKILVVDDVADKKHYYSDYLLNQNIYATENYYSSSQLETYTKLLLGPRFCMLRREFLKQGSSSRNVPSFAQKILITLGGSDPQNITTKVLRTIYTNLGDKFFHIKVIVGSSNLYYKDIENLSVGKANLDIIWNADDIQMASAMHWADLVVSGAGSTVWEVCRVGTPCLLIVIAENQRRLAEKAVSIGIVCGSFDARHDRFSELANCISSIATDQQKRERCLVKMCSIIAENGCMNIIGNLICSWLKLRKAQLGNSFQIWSWNNDPSVRNMSSRKEPIARETHEEWYQERMKDERSVLYIGSDCFGRDIGLVRFQITDSYADVGVVIAPEHRGKGYGSVLIGEGVRRCLLQKTSLEYIQALIFSTNSASLKMVANAGFVEKERFVQDGIEKVLLTFHPVA